MSSKRTMPSIGVTPDGTPQDGADPRCELIGMEWLGDVIVGAQIEALGLVGSGAFGGQQDHWNGGASRAAAA